MKLELSKLHTAHDQQSSTKKAASSSTKISHNSNTTLVTFSRGVKAAGQKTSSVKMDHAGLAANLSTWIEDKTITGKANETCLFRGHSVDGHANLLVVGTGEKLDAEGARCLAAYVHSALKSANLMDVCICMDDLGAGKKDFANLLQAFTEGLLLSDYNFDELKSAKKDDKKPALQIQLSTKTYADAATKKAFAEAMILGECVNFSRRLGDMPGNLMTPTILADTAVEAAKGTGIKSEVWDRARIKKERMGGLYGVAQGSSEEPRFIIMRYNGAAKSKKPVVLVGKGLTFDSGGISIKPGAAMEEMKYDMCGGANVIGAILAIAKLKLKVNVIALVPSTENMPGNHATKPGDVHTARNGKTFEINNTDAEGRLILSDALVYGSEQDPALMVDAATLTGAIIMALGNIHTGYFTRDNALSKSVEAAASESGELVWRMPLTDFHLKDMKGTFADLSNISSGKGAGSATAAAYLEQFVGEGIPWAHFDIAGTGWAVGNRLPYAPKKGASGAILRTFVELARQFEGK